MIIAKPSKGCASIPPAASPAVPTRDTPAATANHLHIDACALKIVEGTVHLMIHHRRCRHRRRRRRRWPDRRRGRQHMVTLCVSCLWQYESIGGSLMMN
uniref:Uncharacterized protein n=1 Tax=Oryza nivara TaxID=4536 RepID=A0A0E0G219_ORYNI